MRFDEALPAATREILKRIDESVLSETVLVRDAMGLLVAVLPDRALPDGAWGEFADALHQILGAYSPGKRRVLLRTSELVDPEDVIHSRDRIVLPEAKGISLIDRLLTNQEWLRTPLSTAAKIPTASFFSIKGGVGRSTATAVLAWHLAKIGKRVLVVDMDLEAPGIGEMLAPESPDFGAVDWFVESLVGTADAELFERMLIRSPLAQDSRGDIQVIPACGRMTAGYVAKLGRVYMPSVGADATLAGLSERLALLISQAASRVEPPDVVLIDTRAGLHDIGSAAVTQIGAEAFLFGRPDDQTRFAYGRLFDHLRHAKSISFGMPDEDLRWRLKMVAAQVNPTVGATADAVELYYETWERLYDDGEMEGAQVFARDDETAPHYPVIITFDPRIRSFDFRDPDRRPTADIIDAVFGRFVKVATERLFPDAVAGLEEQA